MAEPAPRRPELVRGQGQGRGAGAGPLGDRLRRPGRRRRAQPHAAEEPREPAQRQGHRPQPADPRHLRAPCPDARGPPPGRARAARVPAAAPDPPVDAPLAHGWRDRHARSRRVAARDGPAAHPRADQEDEGPRRRRPPPARDHRRAAATGACTRRSRSSATRTPASRRCSTRSSAARSPRPRTSCSRRSTRRRARSSSATARRRSSPTPSGSSTSCRTSWSMRSAPRSRR